MLVVAILGSLWPAIVLHALVDLGHGIMAWLALREGPMPDGLVEAALRVDTQAASGVESKPVQAESADASDQGHVQRGRIMAW
jgi:hypothetical protein